MQAASRRDARVELPQAAGRGVSRVGELLLSAVSLRPVQSLQVALEHQDFATRLAEEQLEVGKKLVEQGTTRIRRFVTEKPVEASVTLHEEHAEVVRRAVTDPSYVQDIDWSDRTVEVIGTAEQAVVSKSSHIAEEVVVGKTCSDHVETVHDTVRRQQVEVERVSSSTGTRKP